MAVSMRVIDKMAKWMDMEGVSIMMVRSMKVNDKIIKDRDREHWSFMMEPNMLGILWMGKNKEKMGKKFFLMALNM